MNKLLGYLFTFSTLTLLSCSGNSNNTSTQQSSSTTDSGAGEKLYVANCAVCHQIGGIGVPSAFPPLANNPTVVGNKAELIKIMHEGLTGEIEVNKMKYNGVMTSFTNLSDTETAQLLTYLRTNMGNKADAITEQEVKNERVKN